MQTPAPITFTKLECGSFFVRVKRSTPPRQKEQLLTPQMHACHTLFLVDLALAMIKEQAWQCTRETVEVRATAQPHTL